LDPTGRLGMDFKQTAEWYEAVALGCIEHAEQVPPESPEALFWVTKAQAAATLAVAVRA
jgi:hypothetical protein